MFELHIARHNLCLDHRRTYRIVYTMLAAKHKLEVAEGVASEQYVPVGDIKNPEKKGWMHKRGKNEQLQRCTGTDPDTIRHWLAVAVVHRWARRLQELEAQILCAARCVLVLLSKAYRQEAKGRSKH